MSSAIYAVHMNKKTEESEGSSVLIVIGTIRYASPTMVRPAFSIALMIGI